MSLYAIKDEDGNLWDRAYDKPETTKTFCAWTDHSDAAYTRGENYPDGRVVELVEKAEPVEVSEAAGELLTSLKEEVGHGLTTHSANYYVTKLKCQHDMSIEDIFRALDVGWTVLKPKRYVLPMDGTSAWGRDGKHKYAFIQGRNGEGAEWQVTQNAYYSDEAVPSVSKEDYDAAPAWVKAIKPVEVTDDEQ